MNERVLFDGPVVANLMFNDRAEETLIAASKRAFQPLCMQMLAGRKPRGGRGEGGGGSCARCSSALHPQRRP